MIVELYAADLPAARLKADTWSAQTGLNLVYKETRGFTPGAYFVFEVLCQACAHGDHEDPLCRNSGCCCACSQPPATIAAQPTNAFTA